MENRNKPELNVSQRLRLAVDYYGSLLGIEWLYDHVKRREWKIKSVTERSEKWQLEQLNRYKAGVLAITSGEETKEDSIRRLYALHVPVTRKTKPAPKVPKDPKPDKKGVPAKNG